MEDPPAGELIHPSTSSPRARLRQFRQEHLYSGTPGRTVWAQSRQTNRPSLCAIIGLNSIPTMQWGHLMVKVVSVSVGIGSLLHTSKKCRTRGSRHRASSYRWKPEDTARTRAAISAGCRTAKSTSVAMPNESVPDSLESPLCIVEQSSPENCSQPLCVPAPAMGNGPTAYRRLDRGRLAMPMLALRPQSGTASALSTKPRASPISTTPADSLNQ